MRVVEAVHAAEASTTAEIVPVILQKSSGYLWVHLWMGLLGFLILSVTLIGLEEYRIREFTVHEVLTAQIISLILGMSLSFIPALKRLWVSKREAQWQTRERAILSLHHSELVNSPERNGVLIFISLFERKIHILPDLALQPLIPQTYWQIRIDDLVRGVHHGKPIDALCNCITEIGKVLQQHFPHQGEKKNVISDQLREE